MSLFRSGLGVYVRTQLRVVDPNPELLDDVMRHCRKGLN